MLAKEHPVLLLCYFIVGIFQVLAGGYRYPSETDEFGTVLFFCSRKECERESEFKYGRGRVQSIPRLGEPRDPVQFHGCGAIRVQFPKQVNHDLTAIYYLYSMPHGYRSRHRDTHEIMLSVLYLGSRSLVWLHPTLY